MDPKKKILVIDDKKRFLKTLSDKLCDEGFNCIKATNGKLGLELALAEHPDIILSGVQMPVMDGVAMMKKLREDEWGRSAKAILITSLIPNTRVADEISSTNPIYYFVKSEIDISAIIVKVKEILDK